MQWKSMIGPVSVASFLFSRNARFPYFFLAYKRAWGPGKGVWWSGGGKRGKRKRECRERGEPMHCIYIVFSLWYISMLSGSTLRFLMTFMCKQRKFLLPPSICRRHRLMTFCYLPGHRVSPDHPQLGITQQRGSIAISGLQWCVGQVCTWTAVRAHV